MHRLTKFVPQLFLLVFGLLLSLGQLEKVTVYASLAIYGHEVLMAIWLLGWCGCQPDFRKALAKLPTQVPKLAWVFLAWLCLGWFLALLNHATLDNALFYTLRLGFYGVFAYSLWWVSRKHLVSAQFMKLSFLTAGFYLLYFGFLQYFFLPDTRFLQFLGWDDHYFRFISTLLDPGFTGIVLILTLFLFFQSYLRYQEHFLSLRFKVTARQKILLLLTTSFLFALAISLTYSRASYVAFLGSGCFVIGYCWLQKRREIALVMIASLLLLAGSLPFLPRPTGEGVKLERTSTIVSRTTSIQNSVTGLKSWQWLVGQGLFVTSGNQLLTDQLGGHNRVPDNWFIMFVTEIGAVGTALLGWMVGAFAWKNWRKNPWFWFAITAVLIHGLFNASLIYVFVLLWLSGLALPISRGSNP